MLMEGQGANQVTRLPHAAKEREQSPVTLREQVQVVPAGRCVSGSTPKTI